MFKYIYSILYHYISPVIVFLKREKLPFEDLPYGYKKRLSALISISALDSFREICPEATELASHRPFVYDQLFITDDDALFKLGSEKARFFRWFRIYYKKVRYLVDGHISFYPTWHSVLSVDDGINKNGKIYVTDTLVLQCLRVESYDKIIPRITGSYTRLVLCGNITWVQAKLLIHPEVQHIKIYGHLIIYDEEYDDFVEFVRQHVRSSHSTFFVRGNYYVDLMLH
uniref:DUF2313 domain-containing protein n=1 Tax=Panagrellus redivivus TaxID=6233 RepID=A0A7E4ZTI2_PANRE